MDNISLNDISWTFHTWMGLFFGVFFIAVILTPWVRKKWPFYNRIISLPGDWIRDNVSDDFKKVLMVIIAIAAAVVYGYCITCSDRASLSGEHGPSNIWHMTARLSMRVFPYFIIGCFLAGFIEKYFRAGRIPIPKSMISNGIFASLIPLCSCAVVPLAQSMMHLHRIRVRAVITFLMVAPILNPMVIPLSWGTLGGTYLGLRILFSFVIAMITGVLIERWAGIKEDSGKPVFSCVGCSRSSATRPEHVGSALMLGWNTMINLLYYMLIGVCIGALFSVYLPPSLVGKYLSNGSLGLLASVMLGIPIYICSGEEVIILSPLMEMGFPMGHAIAFTITGNAICITSISVLIPAFGKRATAIMVCALFFGSIIAGLAINSADTFMPLLEGWIGRL